MGVVASKLLKLFSRMRGDHEDGNTGSNPTMDEMEELIKKQEKRAREEGQRRAAAQAESDRARREAHEAAERARKEHIERVDAERRADEARKAQERLEVEDLEREKLLRLAEQERERIEAESQRLQDEYMTALQSAEQIRRHAEETMRLMEEEKKRADEDRRQAAMEREHAEEERRKAEEDKMSAEISRKAAEEDSQRHREAQARAEEEAKAERARTEQIREELEGMRKAKEAMEKELREGIRPVNIPTRYEFDETKRQLQYQDGLFHFAVAGTSGSGKSSLINALRGLHPTDPGAARVGVTETTLQTVRYPDPDPANPFVWYDIPGSGTLKIRDWQYFNEQGLYIFDCIIVLFDNRFTETDIAILRNCDLFNIPTYIVRSKSHMHIANEANDTGKTKDAKATEIRRRRARESYIGQTRASISKNLQDAGLPDQRVYLIEARETLSEITQYRNKLLATPNEQQSNDVDVPDELISDDGHTEPRTMLGKVTDLLGIVKAGDLGELDILDELDLLYDLLSEARTRRSQKREEPHVRLLNSALNSTGRFISKTYRGIKAIVPHADKSDDASRVKSPPEPRTQPSLERNSSDIPDLSEHDEDQSEPQMQSGHSTSKPRVENEEPMYQSGSSQAHDESEHISDSETWEDVGDNADRSDTLSESTW